MASPNRFEGLIFDGKKTIGGAEKAIARFVAPQLRLSLERLQFRLLQSSKNLHTLQLLNGCKHSRSPANLLTIPPWGETHCLPASLEPPLRLWRALSFAQKYACQDLGSGVNLKV